MEDSYLSPLSNETMKKNNKKMIIVTVLATIGGMFIVLFIVGMIINVIEDRQIREIFKDVDWDNIDIESIVDEVMGETETQEQITTWDEIDTNNNSYETSNNWNNYGSNYSKQAKDPNDILYETLMEKSFREQAAEAGVGDPPTYDAYSNYNMEIFNTQEGFNGVYTIDQVKMLLLTDDIYLIGDTINGLAELMQNYNSIITTLARTDTVANAAEAKVYAEDMDIIVDLQNICFRKARRIVVDYLNDNNTTNDWEAFLTEIDSGINEYEYGKAMTSFYMKTFDIIATYGMIPEEIRMEFASYFGLR